MLAGKTARTLITATAATTTQTSAVQVDKTHVGARLTLNITSNPGGAETLTPQFEIVDSARYGIVGSAAATRPITTYPVATAATNSLFVYELYPGALETTATSQHEVQGGTLPTLYIVKVTHSSTGAWTYTLSIQELI